MKTISLLHYRLAGELAAFLRARCAVGEWEGLGIAALCRRFATSESIAGRAFRSRYGCSIHAFVIRERMRFATTLLADERIPVSEVAYRSGYSCLSNFSRDFARYTGQAPLAWRRAVLRDACTCIATCGNCEQDRNCSFAVIEAFNFVHSHNG